jgi:hypothetical protein
MIITGGMSHVSEAVNTGCRPPYWLLAGMLGQIVMRLSRGCVLVAVEPALNSLGSFCRRTILASSTEGVSCNWLPFLPHVGTSLLGQRLHVGKENSEADASLAGSYCFVV